MGNKTKYITPLIMLLAGAIAAIIMTIRHYELYRMLWTLLIVLIIFYVIGDVVRYLYASVRPTIIPIDDVDEMLALVSGELYEKDEETENAMDDESDNAEEVTSEETENEEDDSNREAQTEEGYTEEELDEM